MSSKLNAPEGWLDYQIGQWSNLILEREYISAVSILKRRGIEFKHPIDTDNCNWDDPDTRKYAAKVIKKRIRVAGI